jgi:hypothetical protein
MNSQQLHESYDRLKSFQKLQLLREIETSYKEVVSDMEIAFDALLSHVSTEDAFFRWREDELAVCYSYHRMAS